jgi:hypothetical protein
VVAGGGHEVDQVAAMGHLQPLCCHCRLLHHRSAAAGPHSQQAGHVTRWPRQLGLKCLIVKASLLLPWWQLCCTWERAILKTHCLG